MRIRVSWVVACTLVCTFAFADNAPSAERIRSAAAEYDAGRRAFTDGKYEDAAVHFENAYHDAPNAQTLRNAIRARKQANQLARAATLAVVAQQNYSDDEPTQQIVKETLAEAGPKLFKITVSCDVECGIAADGHIVSLEDAKRFSFFLQPGPHSVVVSWPGDRNKSLDVKAREGQSLEQTVQMNPGKCYTIVGAGVPTIQNLDIQLVPSIAIPGMPAAVVAADSSQGSTAIVGQQPMPRLDKGRCKARLAVSGVAEDDGCRCYCRRARNGRPCSTSSKRSSGPPSPSRLSG